MRCLKYLLIILIALLVGCADTEEDQTTDNSQQTQLVNPSGKIEDGPCGLLSTVWAASVDSSWNQSGSIQGEMKDIDGSYRIMGTLSGTNAAYYFNGTCFNHVTNQPIDNVIMKMAQPVSATSHNINSGTTLRFFVAEDLFTDPSSTTYQNMTASFVLAKQMVYDYFGFPNASQNFYEMSVTDNTIAGGYLLLFESIISNGRTGPEHNDYIGMIGNAILTNDLTFRANLRASINQLKIKQIVSNLNTWLSDRGLQSSSAPIWNLPILPDYYPDLMTRSPNEIESVNMSINRTSSFDTTGYNLFAYPVRFNDPSTAQYIAAKYATGDLSIYTVKLCNQGSGDFYCPNTKVMDIVKLNEILLPGNSQYNGDMRGHGLSGPVDLFIEEKKQANFTPTFTYAEGAMRPFGNPLASNDSGATWLIITGASYQRGFAYSLFD